MEYLNQNQLIDALSALTPGDSFQPQDILANPSGTILNPDKTIYTYLSSDPSRPHLIHTQNGIITFVQITLGDARAITIEDIKSRYGEPETTAYSAHSHDSLVYSYPSKGLVFITDNTSNNILLVQQIPPLTQDEFNQSVGKQFTKEPYGDQIPVASQTAIASPSAAPFVTPKPNLTIVIITVSLILVSILAFVVYKRLHPTNPPIPKIPPSAT